MATERPGLGCRGGCSHRVTSGPLAQPDGPSLVGARSRWCRRCVVSLDRGPWGFRSSSDALARISHKSQFVLAIVRASDRVGGGGLRPPEPERGRGWAPSQGAHEKCLARRGPTADDRLFAGSRRQAAGGEKCGLGWCQSGAKCTLLGTTAAYAIIGAPERSPPFS